MHTRLLGAALALASAAALLLPAGGATAAPATTITALARCASGYGAHLTVAEARACAPAAAVLPAGSRFSKDGVYITGGPHGARIYTVTSGPITTVVAASPATLTVSASSATYCRWRVLNVLDGGELWLSDGANFCWNYSISWAWNHQMSCSQAILPGGSCLYHWGGIANNYSSSYTNVTDPWSDFCNIYAWVYHDGVGLREDMQPNGNWWGWSFGFGC